MVDAVGIELRRRGARRSGQAGRLAGGKPLPESVTAAANGSNWFGYFALSSPGIASPRREAGLHLEEGLLDEDE
jgi:hypothetical protein